MSEGGVSFRHTRWCKSRGSGSRCCRGQWLATVPLPDGAERREAFTTRQAAESFRERTLAAIRRGEYEE